MRRRLPTHSEARQCTSVNDGAFVHEPLRGAQAVRIFGEVDIANRDTFEHALFCAYNAGEGLLVVDLRDCTFMDLSGVTVLIRWRKALGPRLQVLAKPRSLVHRLLELTHLCESLGVRLDAATANHLAPSAAS